MPLPASRLLPFRIEFGPRAVDDMRRRIEEFRWPHLGYDSGWATGTSDRVLRDLVRTWVRDFDWSRVQAALNERAHVRGEIEGEAMHAMVSAGPAAEHRVPLLMIHGWPSTFADFLDVAHLLGRPDEAGRAFDTVVPSLPGFGFSDAARSPGMHPGRIAERLHALMRALGYRRYGVHGGDWGAIIGTALALQHPEAVIGLHLHHAPGRPEPAGGPPLSDTERAYLDGLRQFRAEESGYVAIQGTRPQSLAYAQNDSPVGLLAWMLEKYWAWSDHGDDLWTAVDRDRVLTNATLYWLTGTALSAMRIYYERAHAREAFLDGFVQVPTGFIRFPRDPWGAPRELVARSYHLVRYVEAERGGHFAAIEQPAALAGDVRAFFAGLA
ncbi:MAG: epoxide hydrolase family protein [Dehalococcoidia bacterium]